MLQLRPDSPQTVREVVLKILAQLCRPGHGDSKFAAGPKPEVAELPAHLRVEASLMFDPMRYDLRSEATALLYRWGPEVGFGRFPEHSERHSCRLEDFRAKESVFSSFRYERRWRQCVEDSESFLTVYRELVEEVVCPHLMSELSSGGDSGAENGPLEDDSVTFHYQYPPTLRLQPGPSAKSRRIYRDAEYGHQEGEVNFWLPLTDHVRTGTTLWVESEPGMGDFHPLLLNHGTMGRFHGTLCRHSVPPNVTDCTRVSIDFRVGIGHFFDPTWTLEGVDHVHARRVCRISRDGGKTACVSGEEAADGWCWE